MAEKKPPKALWVNWYAGTKRVGIYPQTSRAKARAIAIGDATQLRYILAPARPRKRAKR